MMQQVVEQQQTAYLPPPLSIFQESCTPMLDGEWAHLRRTGFLGICKWVERNADTLRFFEVKTNERIYFLRKRYSIPEQYLPGEEYLWIDGDEAALREIEPVIGWVYKRSSLMHCLRDCAEEGQKPSLIEQGFLRSRYIARLQPGGAKPETIVYLEERWNSRRQSYVVPFIFVDERGDYEGFDGVVRNAACEGHIVVRQFLYEIEKVNKALYDWKLLDPPPPKERWMPVTIRQRDSAPVQHSATHTGSASAPTENKSWQTSATGAAQGIGVSATIDPGKTASRNEDADLFMEQHSMNKSALQRNFGTIPTKVPEPLRAYRDTIDSETVRVAPWSPTTIIDLVSLILAIPDPGACDEDEWRRDWAEPAQWLLEITDDGNDPIYAWPKIARHIYGMLVGPTWHVKKAARPFTAETLTLRHVVGWNKATGRLDGHNWRAVGSQLDKENWYPDEIPQYVGPPLITAEDDMPTGYAAGYGGVEASVPTGQVEDVTQASPSPAALEATAGEALDVPAPECDELVVDDAPTESEPAPEGEVPRIAMSTEEAEDLAVHITASHPGISLDYREYGDDDVAVRLEYAPGRWCTVRSVADWNNPPNNALKGMIRDAIAYGAQRVAADPGQNDDERGPPGGSCGEEVREKQEEVN